MGKVIVQRHTTEFPLQLMGEESGVCWGADTVDKEKNYKRGLDCLKSGHGRVSEFPQVYLILQGYSARVIREFYTHNGGMPTRLQASTRYIDYTNQDGFDFVTPPSIANNKAARVKFISLMRHINSELKSLIEVYDIPREDAAMGLPISMTSKVVVRTNARNLIDMSRIRECGRAYWEFRQLIKDIENALKEYSPEWETIVNMEFKPKCEVMGYCNEKHSCGRKPKKEK